MRGSRKKKSNRDIKVFVEVLQNGELLSKTERPMHRLGTIYLTSDPDGDLTAPFYPLPTAIELIKITERGAEVDLDPNWEGFTTFEGKIEDISSDRKTHYTHIMKNGDYGSIAYNDLRVLIRIGKDRPKKKDLAKPTGEYKGRILPLLLGNQREIKMLALGLLGSAWIFGGLVFGLMNRPDDRPRRFVDLRPEYTLAFIHPRHLSNLPEALQEHYKPKEIIKSAYGYFKSLSATILNIPHNRHPAVYPSTFDLYLRLYRENQQKIRSLEDQLEESEAKLLAKPMTATIRIPAIRGETLGGKLLRLQDKISILHESLEASLLHRHQFTTSFTNDPGYEFEKYKRVQRQKRPENQDYSLTKLGMNEAERAMYQEAQNLANYARFHQKKMRQFAEPKIPLQPDNYRPVAIPKENPAISYLVPESFKQLNRKLSMITAAQFDATRSGMVKEPLLGEIDPKLIQKTIEKNRFELQLCFELALRRNQNLSGEMEWQWRLDSRGELSDLELLNSSIRDRRMIRCVRKKIARWKFPRPRRGSIQVKYPFRFDPARG